MHHFYSHEYFTCHQILQRELMSNIQLDIINYTENHILAKVVEENGFAWTLTCCYGWPKASQKHKTWAMLSHLSSLVQGPWCCIGDFNAILQSSEKLSRFPPSFKQMDEFHMTLDSCNLADLRFIGYKYLWNNKRLGAANTRERLDRAVANAEWRGEFPVNTMTFSSHMHQTTVLWSYK